MRFVARTPAVERTQAGEARRTAMDLAARIGLSEAEAGELAIAVTEAATNLHKHATGGEILLSTRAIGRRARIEMLALDRGPGMQLDRCLTDGYSTAGSAGTGLGAIRRLAAEFDAYSSDHGTVIFAAFGHVLPAAGGETPVVIGSAAAPKPGETECGDAWTAVFDTSVRVLVVDGLGHGALAADAAAQAIDTFESNSVSSPAEAVEVLHAALRGSRGAALAVAGIDRAASQLSYCGLGNIAGSIVGADDVKRLVSMNGTAGHNASRINPFQYRWTHNSTLVMHSDGLSTHWNLPTYAGLAARHPSVIAGVLLRDFSRGRDDCVVVVAKQT